MTNPQRTTSGKFGLPSVEDQSFSRRHIYSKDPVNFPEVALPGHPHAHRLLHVHANVPGVLSAINRVFSDNNINIAAQYLQTNDKVGYVVLDVNSAYSPEALKQLREIDGTIRCRVLF